MKVCMLAYTFYETDNRVRRYAETLVKRGDQVDVIALRKKYQSHFEILKGVNIYKIQERNINENGKLSYMFKLILFFINSFIFLTKMHLKKRYDLIHVHSIPDFEVFATLIPKLTGAKIILDIHDIVPELYVSKFNCNENSIIYKALVFIEKISCNFSDKVITANHIWEKKLISRSVKKNKCSVIMNFPDPSIFYKRHRVRKDDKFIIIYPGTLNYHQGLDIAINAFNKIKNDVPKAEFHIYGRGPEKRKIELLIKELNLENRVLIKDLLPMEEISEIMANSDLGVVPKRKGLFGDEALSTKILEFMLLGIPVIAADTKIERYYFNDSIIKFFKAGNVKDLAESMLKMIKDENLREKIRTNAMIFVQGFSWEKRKVEYLELIKEITKSKNRKKTKS